MGEKIIEKINTMRSIRLSYPGWIVLPIENWEDFKDCYTTIPYLENAYKQIEDKNEQLQFVYELNWRMSIFDFPIISEWLVNAIMELTQNKELRSNSFNLKLITELQLSLLRIYRLRCDWGNFDKLSHSLLESTLFVSPRKIYYQLSLEALYVWNFKKLDEICINWPENYGDYQNCLQKAEMLHILGKSEEVKRLLDRSIEAASKVLIHNNNDEYAKSSLPFLIDAEKRYLYNTRFYSDELQLKNDRNQGNNINKIAEAFTNKILKKEYKLRDGHSFVHTFAIGGYADSWNMGESAYEVDFVLASRWFLIKERLGLNSLVCHNVVDKYSLNTLFPFSPRYTLNVMMCYRSGGMIETTLTRDNLRYLNEQTANSYFDLFYPILLNQYNIATPFQNIIISCLPSLLQKICTVCSQDRVSLLLELFLKLNPMLISKECRILMDSIGNKGIEQITEPIILQKLNAGDIRHTIEFPCRYIESSISELAKNKIINGLRSKEVGIQKTSLTCFEYLLQYANLNSETLNEISSAVRTWRKDTKQHTENTYNYVKPNNGEKSQLNELVERHLNKFLETDYQVNGSSAPLSSWLKDLRYIYELKQWLNDGQAALFINHNVDLIEKNIDVFQKEGSNEIFFGIRHFTEPIVSQFCDYLLTIKNERLTRFNLEGLLSTLRSFGYRCLPPLVLLHINDKETLDNDMKTIFRLLFSNDKNDRTEATSAFFVLMDSRVDVNPLLDKIISVLEVARPEAYQGILILFANVLSHGSIEIPGFKDNNRAFFSSMKSFLIDAQNNYATLGFNVTDLADFMYYINFAAGAYSEVVGDITEPIFNKEECHFNDVYEGFECGKELIKGNAHFYKSIEIE